LLAFLTNARSVIVYSLVDTGHAFADCSALRVGILPGSIRHQSRCAAELALIPSFGTHVVSGLGEADRCVQGIVEEETTVGDDIDDEVCLLKR